MYLDKSITFYHYVKKATTKVDNLSKCLTTSSVTLEKNTSMTNYTKNVTNYLTYLDQNNQGKHYFVFTFCVCYA